MTENPDMQELEAERDSWEEWLYGVGEEATRISVYRFHPTTAKQEYCGSLPAEGFDVEAIRQRWGGGNFSLRAFGPAAKGRPGGYMGHKIVNVAGPIRDLSRAAEPETEPERERRRADELEARLEEIRQTQDRDRIAALERAVGQLLEEIRRPPPQAATADPFRMALELVKEMQARVVPHVETPMSDGRSLIEAFTQGLRVGSELDGGERHPYADVIERIGMPLLRLAERQWGDGAPAHLHDNPPDEDDSAPMSSADSLRAALSRWVPTLMSWAAAGRSPEVKADFIVDELPEVWRSELAEFLLAEGGGAITKLLGWFPQLGQHRPWVERLIAGLRYSLLEEDGEGNDDEDGAEEVEGAPELGTLPPAERT